MKASIPFLYHILDEIQYILDKTESLTVDDIRLDPDLSRSIPRSLEIIGEAVKTSLLLFGMHIRRFPGVILPE